MTTLLEHSEAQPTLIFETLYFLKNSLLYLNQMQSNYIFDRIKLLIKNLYYSCLCSTSDVMLAFVNFILDSDGISLNIGIGLGTRNLLTNVVNNVGVRLA
jgi:hypothetical protein